MSTANLRKGMGIQARTGKNETRDAEIHVCARRGGEEADETCLRVNTEIEQSRPADKVSYT